MDPISPFDAKSVSSNQPFTKCAQVALAPTRWRATHGQFGAEIPTCLAAEPVHFRAAVHANVLLAGFR
jgi:hypothetical protein